jgi:hydrogenase maturation protein HypF
MDGEDVLAIGGELKATFCLAKGTHAYVSQHIGDLGNLETLESLDRNVRLLETLLQARPTCIACDSHPGYLSAQWARERAASSGIALFEVQHHHAHLASLAAEHQLAVEEPLFGFVFDGTGYGTDQTIWGGEALVSQSTHVERVAHLQPFLLPGGDAAVQHPYRVALSLLAMAGLPWSKRFPCVQACNDTERKVLERQLDRRINCVVTTSMGRLFDAVASLIGLRHSVSYEAQAAMELETLATNELNRLVGPFDTGFEVPQSVFHTKMDALEFPLTSLVTQIADWMRQNASMGFLAAQFHLAVVDWMRMVSSRIRDARGISQVGLSGGVFQNALLTQLATKALTQDGFSVLSHRVVPCNDGGLALGQAWLARLRQRD